MAKPGVSHAREISAIDLRFLEKEWELAGGFIRKVYHSPGSEKLAIEIFVPQKGTLYLSVLPSWVSLDKAKPDSQKERDRSPSVKRSAFSQSLKPSGFCMFLRKHLSGKRIERIGQRGFDRILEIEAGGLRLILEFVPPGNVILADSQGIIMGALNTKRWRDREIRPKAAYQYPPERPNPFSMDIQAFGRFFIQDKKTAAVLASDLGIGPEYANRLCAFAGVRPDKPGRSLDEKEIAGLLERLPRLERISGSPVVEERNARQERLERIELQRREGLEKWKAAEKLARERADAIYRKFDTVESLLGKFHSRKDSGFEPMQKAEGLHITASLDGVSVPLDLKKTAQENASFYYEQAKKAKRKLAGLEASMQKPLQERTREEPQEYPDQEQSWLEGAEAPSVHRWFEKFKWFRSSEGTLVVAGRSADQNEILLKSHAEPEEWCFHADVKGAAFTIIKSPQASEQTKKEAAEFAAAQSKAWQKGFGSVHVFSVQRKSLSKTPPTGMFLPKGSFMVSGQRVWYRNIPLRLAIGANEKGEIISGPESAVKKNSAHFVMIVPGDKKASDLSREIKSEFLKGGKQKDLDVFQKLSLDEIARHVPSGSGQLERK